MHADLFKSILAGRDRDSELQVMVVRGLDTK